MGHTLCITWAISGHVFPPPPHTLYIRYEDINQFPVVQFLGGLHIQSHEASASQLFYLTVPLKVSILMDGWRKKTSKTPLMDSYVLLIYWETLF